MSESTIGGAIREPAARPRPVPLNLQIGTPWAAELEHTPLSAEIATWFERSAYLPLGTTCNQDCGYCFQDKGLGWEPTEVILQQIQAAANQGVTAFHLIGGEPLIYPDLWRVIDAINRSDVPRWGIMTNGIALGSTKMLQRLLDEGLGFVHISMDSPRPEVQNALAGNPMLFGRLERAFDNLAELADVPVMLNAVITKSNIDHLSEMVEFCARLRDERGLRSLVSFTQTKPGEYVEEDLIVPARTAADAVLAAIRRGTEIDIQVHFRNLPFCLVDGFEQCSTDWFTLLYDVDDQGVEVPSHDIELVKFDKCYECSHVDRCPGVQQKYVDRFGDDEFQPVFRPDLPPPPPREALRAPAAPARGRAEQAPVDVHSECDTGELRLDIGDVRQGDLNWFDVDDVLSRRPHHKDGDRVVLCGPEVMFHPQLPEIIEQLSSERPVWIETTGLALTRVERARLLADYGLTGVCWLHLPDGGQLYRKLMSRGRRPAEVERTAQVLREADLGVEHRFPAVTEPIERTVERMERVYEFAGRRGGISLCFLPYAEKWSRWLDAPEREPLDEREVATLTENVPGVEILERRWELPGSPDQSVPHSHDSPRDEASSERTGSDSNKPQASILLGTKCDFRCEFCYLPDHKTTVSREDTLASVRRVLDTGIRQFLIAGGEPTLFPHFFDALEELVPNAERVTVVTNGARVSKREFAERLWEVGVRDVLLSFHSHMPEVYDALSQRRNVFPNIMQAYETLTEVGFSISVHHVLYERNYRHFPDFVRFYLEHLYRPGCTELTVSNVLLVNEAFATRADQIPRLTDILPYYREGVAVAREGGVDIRQLDAADAFPECVYGVRDSGPVEPSAERWIAPATPKSLGTIFAGPPGVLPDIGQFRATNYNEIFTHIDACESCSRRPGCIGLQRAYVEHYGTDEFEPITE